MPLCSRRHREYCKFECHCVVPSRSFFEDTMKTNKSWGQYFSLDFISEKIYTDLLTVAVNKQGENSARMEEGFSKPCQWSPWVCAAVFSSVPRSPLALLQIRPPVKWVGRNQCLLLSAFRATQSCTCLCFSVCAAQTFQTLCSTVQMRGSGWWGGGEGRPVSLNGVCAILVYHDGDFS